MSKGRPVDPMERVSGVVSPVHLNTICPDPFCLLAILQESLLGENAAQDDDSDR